MKINHMKHMHTININVVQGHTYKIFQDENLSYKSFITWNLQYLIS